MVEPLQMDDQQFWKAKQRNVFLNIDLLFTSFALVPRINYLLHVNELLHAVLDCDASNYTSCFTRDFNRQVHEIIESVCLVVAAHAGDAAHDLSLKQVSHD